MNAARKVLFVLTSHDTLGETGRATGFYLPEAAHPWKALTDAGFEVDLVSVKGGRPSMDGGDTSDVVQLAFLEDARMAAKLENTLRPEEITPGDYEAILFVGGHGTMWDFPNNAGLTGIARDIYEAGGVVAAVCHGPAALVNLTLSDGTYLVAGKNVAAFTNAEEEAAELVDVVPFSLQSKLEERGAKHTSAPNFEAHVVVDGRLVTGQNPASATTLGQALATTLTELRAA
ncbi:type 1 glutamine amidotransferase domain-containing protein [Streptomyces sp. NPDC048639]|uniref:type 1 glutamine amidotransferase domain-containing protein n=1 Tax=Streptomyces sp. NPDC048639 TaxID=3365581 RepID=UPI0037110591